VKFDCFGKNIRVFLTTRHVIKTATFMRSSEM